MRFRSKKRWRKDTASFLMSGTRQKNSLVILTPKQKWFASADQLTSATGPWGKLHPHPYPPHAQHRQEHGVIWERPSHSEHICMKRGSNASCQSENIHQFKMEILWLVNFSCTQATPLDISQGLETKVPIPPHPPQSPSASTPNNRIYKEEPKLDGCSNPKRHRTGSNWVPGIFSIFCHRSYRKRPGLSTSDPRGRIISCHLSAKTAGEVDINLHGRAEQGVTKITVHEPKVKRGSMGLLVSPF